jgi:hypothetical protein
VPRRIILAYHVSSCVNAWIMRSFLSLLLLLPSVALGGQDVRSGRPVATPDRSRAVATDPAGLCESAVTTAEFVARLPPRLLGAISLTESGRIDPDTGVLRPWPWTINAEGEGRFFATSQDAIAAATALQARGVQSIDVGCLQVNLMYHPQAFATLAQAFDPRSNALYAAGFLNTLYADGRDWSRAIAAYHSETPALGDAYRVMVLARWQNPILQNPSLREASPASLVYRDFAPESQVYGAFAPAGRVYGAFGESSAGRYQAGH